ncbi:MAG: hypothetical protein ACC726_02585 [Chloroflexota bacterium]
MSSGACRALVAVLLTLVATTTVAVPVGAATEKLRERSTTTYTVDPRSGEIDVQIVLTLTNTGDRTVNLDEWGPVYLEDGVIEPRINGRGVSRTEFTPLPGLWKSMQLKIPKIESGDRLKVQIRYTISAPINGSSARAARTPARISDGYVYFCVPGQDTDSGEVKIVLPSRYQTTQSGTLMEETDSGLTSNRSNNPVDQFTCIEGTAARKLEEDRFARPDGREVILQAWPESRQWLVPARANVQTALDDLGRFIGHDIPGDGPIIIRQAPPRSLGGYASAHDIPGIVQLDEAAGVDPDNRNHEIAHVWFGTNNFPEQWMREGMATWTSSSLAQDTCAPASGGDSSLDLAEWQVVKPTAPADIEDIVEAQYAAACGIVAAVVDRMDADTWNAVMGSMLNAEAKYVGSGRIGAAPTTIIDYREWLDAVDERGLVPAGNTDLDFAQDLLADYGVTPDSLLLLKRSEARARYHQFLADAAPMGAPAIVREAMDNWSFDEAQVALDKSYEVLGALREADALLPEAGLVPFIRPGFEAAREPADLDDVLAQAQILLDAAEEIIPPLSDLRAASPDDWGLPAAVRNAITDQRFDEVITAIDPALEIVQEVIAADAALPQAGLLDKYRARYESTATTGRLEELATSARVERSQAEQAGIAFTALQSEVGDWSIPAAVTKPIDAGRISTALAILEDARGVVGAAKDADAALPEANLSADIRLEFEAVKSGAEMAALRAAAEETRADARSVGAALNSLRSRVPGWTIPDVVSRPVEERDFALAAVTAAAAQKWVENAWQADQDLPDIDALSRARPAFEAATTLEELREGGALAEDWATASSRVGNAVRVESEERNLLANLGLWGTDVQPVLGEAIAAAISGDVALATAKSAEVIETIRGGSTAGGLRLAGLVFFSVAVFGVLGMWFVLRRQRGPSWARQTRPHWIEAGKSLRSRDKKDKK